MRSKTRILVLHDAHSSIGTTRAYLEPLEDRLFTRHGIELVYLQGTYPAEKPDTGREDSASASGEYDGGDSDADWYLRERIKDDCMHDPHYSPRQWFDESNLVGLDASLHFLHQIWCVIKFVHKHYLLSVFLPCNDYHKIILYFGT